MRKAMLYIHGKGGSAEEAAQFSPFCAGHDVRGISLADFTPWGSAGQIHAAFGALHEECGRVSVLANSIGAYLAMCALHESSVERAFFISPVLDMERLILAMMKKAGVTEADLRERGEVRTDFGETLSWKYLSFVRENPVRWSVPTEILCAEHDELLPHETFVRFASAHDAHLTVMPGGEHWFHTPQQMAFLGAWLREAQGD